jgi:hypothetical protein
MDPNIVNDLLTGTKILGGASALIGGVRWSVQAMAKFSRMAESLDEIKNDIHTIRDNHLPHLDSKINDLKDAFNAHLVESAKTRE